MTIPCPARIHLRQRPLLLAVLAFLLPLVAVADIPMNGIGWKATVGPDGILTSMQADFGRGKLEPVPLRHDKFAGPAWYFRNGGQVVRPKLAALADNPCAFEGTEAGIRFHLEYVMNEAGLLSIDAKATNTTDKPWQPETAGVKLGLDCMMEKYPEWNHRFVPTLLRCEKTHFWGYAMMPDGGVMAIASFTPVASWSIDYVGDHRIATFNVDLLNALPLPTRHPQDLTTLAPGETKRWSFALMPFAKPEDIRFWWLPRFAINRFTIAAGETATGQVHCRELESLTLTRPDGKPEILPTESDKIGIEHFSFPAKEPGLYTLAAKAKDGKIAEATIFVRQPLAWYLERARLEGLRVKPTATHHAECIYPFHSYFLSRKWLPEAKTDAQCETVFHELFPQHYDDQKNELRTSWRIQDSAVWAGILADRYAVTHDEKDLEHAAALCDFLINKHQGQDGAFYLTAHKQPVHYTSVIYLAKSIMEVMAEEKPLAAANPQWKERYERHQAAVKRAVDDLAKRCDNLQTEGEQTYEDGMISCSIAQLAMYAIKLGDPKAAEPYLAPALALYDGHRCLTMTDSPDARVNGSTIRYWETKYTICLMANMNNSPCGWTAWKLYADNYLYQLTGDERYLREYFNGLGACLQVIDAKTGRLRWGLTPNPYVRSRYAVKGDGKDPKAEHRWENGVFGEQYLEMISDWNRSKPIWRQKWGIDNFVHEIFKCMEEGALSNVYLLERPDGSLACYNGTVKLQAGIAVITPNEPQACRLHLNLRHPAKIKTTLGGIPVDGTFEGRQWIGPGGIPPDLRPF
jgi:hypothetical protein